jgi:hypothetical protein
MRILFTRLKIRSALSGTFAERKRKDAFPMSACLPLCPSARNNSTFTEPIFVKFVIREFYTNLSNRLKFGQNLDKNNNCFTRKPTSHYSVTRNSILFLEKLVDPQCEINRTQRCQQHRRRQLLISQYLQVSNLPCNGVWR